ncbi:MAG: sugar phosphate isomerase/epimerase [Trueperaceae bacterium]|nr:sugar phosphate isomerase/epimerase [Trueperaceae bacterium]
MNSPRIALQLYTLRNSGRGLEELLPLVAAAGYDGVETASLAGVDAIWLRDKLADNGLAVASAHVALKTLREDLGATVAYHAALGTPLLVVPWLSEEDRPGSADGWRALGGELGELSRRVRQAGMGLAYHNHDFELVFEDGRSWLESLANGGLDGGLGIEVDVGWVAAVGLSPLTLLDRLGSQVVRLHAKDVTALGSAVWEDVGHGALDWPPLLLAARAAAVEWLVVEHDDPTEPLDSMRLSAAALRALLAA